MTNLKCRYRVFYTTSLFGEVLVVAKLNTVVENYYQGFFHLKFGKSSSPLNSWGTLLKVRYELQTFLLHSQSAHLILSVVRQMVQLGLLSYHILPRRRDLNPLHVSRVAPTRDLLKHARPLESPQLLLLINLIHPDS